MHVLIVYTAEHANQDTMRVSIDNSPPLEISTEQFRELAARTDVVVIW